MASSLSLSLSQRFTQKKNKWRITSPVFCFWVLIFFHIILRALLHKVDTISFLTTLRPFERVLARRNECTKALLVVFPRKEREREAVFFARVFSPFFFFLIKVSSSSLERKNFAKKNARVCFVKEEEEEECERVLFASFRKERRSTRSPSPERGAFLRREVICFVFRARVFYKQSFFSPLIFFAFEEKMFGKNATQKSSSSSPLKRETTTTTTTTTTAPKPKTRKEEDHHPKNDDASVYFFILSLGESSETIINGVFRRRPESDASKAPPRVPRCQTTTS